jgi:hypothetical protein
MKNGSKVGELTKPLCKINISGLKLDVAQAFDMILIA